MKTPDSYAQSLILALHARRIPPARIGEIVAEVDSHVAETGEDPRDAFGEPREYAQAVAPQLPRRGLRIAAEVLVGAITGFAVITALMSLLTGQPFLGMPLAVSGPIAVALFALAVRFVQRLRPPVRDPRTGTRLSPGGGTAFAIVTGTAAICVALGAALAMR